MSSDRDVTRIVRSWLEEGATQLPDRVLDSVLDQVPATPQRRAWWPAQRFPLIRSNRLRFGIAVAAVIAAAVVGLRFLPPSNLGGPQRTATPSPTPAPSPTPVPLNGQLSLEAGVYEARVNGHPVMRITVAVPEGWEAFERWALSGPSGPEPPAGYGVGFWAVENLYADPLDLGRGFLDPAVGPTVNDLVDALVSHQGWTTTAPTDVTIDGYSGSYLELTVPADARFGGCESTNGFLLWTTPDGGWRCAQGPGQIHHIYVLDVEGERLVVAALSFPETPEEGVAALQAMVDSIQIQ
jgi:hypothetical protein